MTPQPSTHNRGMSDPTPAFLEFCDLLALATAGARRLECTTCSALVCAGWESMPGAFDRKCLRQVGTLRRSMDEEPTLQEYHPNGTHAWSADAPIAPAFHPCNRCDVWQCVACARPFLRYTEYGGYYQDERVRELNATLVVDAAP